MEIIAEAVGVGFMTTKHLFDKQKLKNNCRSLTALKEQSVAQITVTYLRGLISKVTLWLMLF